MAQARCTGQDCFPRGGWFLGEASLRWLHAAPHEWFRLGGAQPADRPWTHCRLSSQRQHAGYLGVAGGRLRSSAPYEPGAAAWAA